MEDIECKQLNKENEDSDVEEIEEAPQQVNKPINKEQDAIARERFLRILLAMQNKQVPNSSSVYFILLFDKRNKLPSCS